MCRYLLLALLCIDPAQASTDAAAPRQGPVQVDFVEPETFRDARLDGRTRRDARNPLLDEFSEFLAKFGQRHLHDGQTLAIRFTDIDLAGHIEPTTHPALHDIRIVKSVYPPRLNFDWELRDAEGSLLRHGNEALRDLGFNLDSAALGRDRLRYEKRLLRRWLQRTLGPPPGN
jgi:hypothetical protein